MTAETVIFEREGPIGRLRLNRPAKLNAQTPQMWAELRELGRALRDDRELHCVGRCVPTIRRPCRRRVSG